MTLINYQPTLTKQLIEMGFFRADPMTILDIGCSGGITDPWLTFGDQLRALGVDPQQSEIERLNREKTLPGIDYVAAYIELPAQHPFKAAKNAGRSGEISNALYGRLSSTAAAQMGAAVPMQSNSILQNHTEARMTISELVRQRSLPTVDFIKIDTDGFDLEALVSSVEILRSSQVLGFMVEAQFAGSANETDNCFHNIDRFMKAHGFQIYVMDPIQYTRRDLPGEFKYNILAQTHRGQMVWADVVFFRDFHPPTVNDLNFSILAPTKLLKLACLMEIFNLQDCAAELFNHFREQLSTIVKVDSCLDVLAQSSPVRGQQLSYQELMSTFRNRISDFMPKS